MSPAGRDRDAAGRPRSARPRDAAGRPLPRGAAGISPVPDEPPGPPGAVIEAAQRLLDDGRPFAAHEVLEAAWKAAPEPERQLWRGLAQLAVGLTHAQRGNRRGAVALLERGAAGIEPYADRPPHGLDIAGVIVAARRIAGEQAAGDQPAGPPALRLSGGAGRA
ncbi:MAG: DUF309 domain-containing protein [Frankiaceae bacterium]